MSFILHPSQFLSMWVHHFTLPRFCSSSRLPGTPRQFMKNADEIVIIFCTSVYVIFGSILVKDSTLETFWGNGHCHSTTPLIVFRGSRATHECLRLISKTVFKTLKYSRYSLVVVMSRHTSNISSRKINTAGRRCRRHANGCTEYIWGVGKGGGGSQVLQNWCYDVM